MAAKSSNKDSKTKPMDVDYSERMAENNAQLVDARLAKEGKSRRTRIFYPDPVYGEVMKVNLRAEEPQEGVIAQNLHKPLHGQGGDN